MVTFRGPQIFVIMNNFGKNQMGTLSISNLLHSTNVYPCKLFCYNC